MPLANDDFANAEVLTGAVGSVSFDNTDATTEVGEPTGSNLTNGIHRTAWYSYVPFRSGTLTLDTHGSTIVAPNPATWFDTTLAVWQGASLGTLTEIGSDDDSGATADPATASTSLLAIHVVIGEEYLIQVGSYSDDDTLNVVLNWSLVPADPSYVALSTGYGPISVDDARLSHPSDPSPSIADGDWIVLWLAQKLPDRLTIDDTTGWTQLEAADGSTLAGEVWVYHWHTGDPKTWTATIPSSSNNHEVVLTVWRDVQADVTLVAPLHFTTTSPATADAITDAAIGSTDVAMVFYAAYNSVVADISSASPTLLTPGAPTDHTGFSGGTLILFSGGYRITGTNGTTVQVTAPVSGTITETIGTQVVLAGLPSRPFPLRLRQRGDNLNSPRLPRFHDSRQRTSRLGAGSYF